MANLVSPCDKDDEAVILAIALLLRPEFLNRSDERATAAVIADRVGYGIRRAAELAAPPLCDDLTPTFWVEMVRRIRADLMDFATMADNVAGPWTAEDCAIFLSIALGREVTAQEWRDHVERDETAPIPFTDEDEEPRWRAEEVLYGEPSQVERFVEDDSGSHPGTGEESR
ncbi:hypothetical protein [Actinomadura geliboluensis]|uniref:hypothetical protein n=1 Tax=Actinomadura geliboluensis TaxID=882440 RepID=UPI0036AB4E9C